MRDPKRIPEMVRLLECIWFQNPDLRLGQLMAFLSHSVSSTVDEFYIEDDRFLEGMKQMLA